MSSFEHRLLLCKNILKCRLNRGELLLFTSPGAIGFELHTWKLSGRPPPSCDPPWELYTSLAEATSTFGSRWMLSSPPLRVLPQTPHSKCTCSHSSTLALATSGYGPPRKTWASAPSPSSQGAWVSIPPAGSSSKAQSSSCLRSMFTTPLLDRIRQANHLKRPNYSYNNREYVYARWWLPTQSVGNGLDRVYILVGWSAHAEHKRSHKLGAIRSGQCNCRWFLQGCLQDKST